MDNLLKRLRELRAQECCRHIDDQVKLWLSYQTGAGIPNESTLHQTTVATNTQAPAFNPEKQNASDEKTIGFFLANLKHLESLDSDATESTSSNDSFDELEGFSQEDIPPKRIVPTYKSPHAHTGASAASKRISHLQSSDVHSSSHTNAINGNLTHMADLKKKSIWKWAKERSRLASKWTWLQAQIADLEFRVRGQNDALMQARLRKVPPIPQTLPESACSRTVPLSKDFRNRSSIKSTQILSDSSKSSVKFSHVPCVCSSLPQTVAPCLSCKGRYNYLKQLEDDITLGSQISYLLKQETLNRKPVKGKPGRKKGSTAAALATLSSQNEDKNGKLSSKKSKFYQGMSNRASNHAQGSHLKNPSQTMIASNKLKRKYRKHSNNPNNYDSNSWFGSNNHAHNNSYNNSTKRNKRIRSASSMNESSMHSDSSNPYRPNHFNQSAARGVTRRRRSEQSAYDIDNIVIPFSVAATTRVEILEYKEIVTPSWRILENGACNNDNNVHGEEDTEDISDEAYIMRHTKGEHEEKKRFSIKPPPKNENQNAPPTSG